jgi:hypothetical protein
VVPQEIALKYRTTIFYLLAAALLAGIYLYELREDKKKERARETAQTLCRIRPDRLSSITLKRAGGSITVQKIGDPDKKTWKITSPVHSAIDSSAIEALNNKLADLNYTRIITETPVDLAEFGLDSPWLIITYEADKEHGTLIFGGHSPIDYGFYALKDVDQKVYLISKDDKEILDKGLFELRDKRLFALKPENVQRFIIERETVKWALVKKQGRWIWQYDEEFRVDQKRVDSLITSLAWTRASSFEKEAVDRLEPFGLHRPRARITLSDGVMTQVILLGDTTKKKNSKIYAKMQGRPQVVVVEKWLLDDLPQNKYAIKE